MNAAVENESELRYLSKSPLTQKGTSCLFIQLLFINTHTMSRLMGICKPAAINLKVNFRGSAYLQTKLGSKDRRKILDKLTICSGSGYI